ncbi:STAS domain-containing protein [Kitasatospora indigofera]|uniref:STAS domain-containing protein n=1 Tax=Kitasatospora indigofera TaxID=67307 RepID=UPI00362C62CB
MSTAHVTYGQRHGWTTVHLNGDLDTRAVSAVRERLLHLIWDGCRHLVVDLERLESCDPSGFAVLAAARRHMAARDGDLRLVLPPHRSAVRQGLTALGITKVFQVYESTAAAVVSHPHPSPTSRIAYQRGAAESTTPGAIPTQRR